MSVTKSNVTAAKPQITGAVSVAQIGTTPPTSADVSLASAFKNLGYISEDGLTNATELDREVIKAWGGDPVLVVHNGKEDTFTFTLIEVMNDEVLKFIHGSSNVSGSALSSGYAVTVKNEDSDDVVAVIDMILRGGVLKRIVIPCAHITEVGEVKYADGEAVGYEITLTAIADASGMTHYEYLKTPSSGGGGGGTT